MIVNPELRAQISTARVKENHKTFNDHFITTDSYNDIGWEKTSGCYVRAAQYVFSALTLQLAHVQ